MRSARPLVTALAAVVALGLSACGGGGSGGSSSSSSSSSQASSTGAGAAAANQCTKGKLKTTTPGTLTVATDKPAFPPYFEDNDPSNGKGFESAVAYAVAKRLGYAPGDVKWTTEPFNASYAPGPKKFDFDVNQISITPARAKQVDFSTPYFTAPQALVALKSSPAAKAASLADVQKAKLGVQIGTTSLDAVQQVVKPSSQPKVFNDSNDVVTALKQKQVDAVVVDLPTAFFLTAAQVPTAKIVGQFSAPGGDKWGALLAKGSPLTQCVSQAVADLRESGQLQALQQRWMGSAAGAPVLK
jgi:polar amino acid transport system substrate-binding protein